MNRAKANRIMKKVFAECDKLREAGQQEYAHDDSNAFANFERVANDLGIAREKSLWVFAMKHRDGIASYLKGYTSQRENVRGRINDLIVYLCLLRAMIDENEGVCCCIPPNESCSQCTTMIENVHAGMKL